MSVRRAPLFSLSLALGIVSQAPAFADKPATPGVSVTCDFVEVWAKGGKPRLDPALPRPLAKKLRAVKQWVDYKQLSNHAKPIAKKHAEKLKLARGSATATLVEIVDKSKVRMTIDFASAKGQANQTLLFDAGDWVTTAVQQPNGDGHLLAVSCK